MNKDSQSIVLHVLDSGDRSVGIPPYDDTITLTFEHGGWDKEFLQSFENSLKEFLKESLCECGGRVLNMKELAAYTKAEMEEDSIEEFVENQIKTA